MNTLVENIPANTVVAPNRLLGKLAHRILVVEDDEAIRELNVEVLVHSNYQVDGAEDGAAGWDLLAARTFDLLAANRETSPVLNRARGERQLLIAGVIYDGRTPPKPSSINTS